MKQILSIQNAPTSHWVGDGFPVRSILSHHEHGSAVSPFLLLDYGGPAEFGPTDKPRGVDQHPHKGFETVTIVYEGELEHRDSTGQSGKIGPGDVQWMTAGAGIVHEEKHSREFTRTGGKFEMVQLWVNLPAKEKSTPPGYQTLLSSDIPTVQVPGAAVRIIAGDLNGTRGPARTFTELNVWDVRLSGGEVELPVPHGHNAQIIVLRGRVVVAGETAGEGQMTILGKDGEGIRLRTDGDAAVLLLSGEPIEEPVVAYGPFVMNSQAEIYEAIDQYRSGRMGTLQPLAAR